MSRVQMGKASPGDDIYVRLDGLSRGCSGLIKVSPPSTATIYYSRLYLEQLTAKLKTEADKYDLCNKLRSLNKLNLKVLVN